ncbi:hypothetical protein [Nocardia arizonensis]|uniref:hypothetical protein n=1 Tax=Nocardia arizonensis TaxID=1141647 RepID=UPI0012E2C7B1|nr:hypothetical protein [Nocardia arizonensis]
MRYLDYIPRLVEAYERQRARGKAHLFDKFGALVAIMHELNDESTDLNLSIRHYQAFARILTGLLDSMGRISPDFDTVVWALETCFPPVFRERTQRHLLGYFDQVKVERIGRISGSKEPVFQMNTAAQNTSRNLYVARSCTQLDHYYEYIRVPGERSPDDIPDTAPDMSPGVTIDLDPPAPPPGANKRSGDWNETWPPSDVFRIDMRHKAFRLAGLRNTSRVKSHEFRGSMQDGLDLRRTLRSYYRSQPRLYVKQEMRVRRQIIDLDEPVLWLFDDYASVDFDKPEYDSRYTWAGERNPERVLELYVLDISRKVIPFEDRSGAPAEIRLDPVHALLTFIDWNFELPTEENFRRLGRQLDQRLPLVDEVHDFGDLCADMSVSYQLNLSNARWWEVLLATALHHAKDRVVLVAPQKFIVPEAIARRFAAERKDIVRISMNGFTRDELRLLQTYHSLAHIHEPVGDPSAPEHRAFVTDHFGDLMKRFWA